MFSSQKIYMVFMLGFLFLAWSLYASAVAEREINELVKMEVAIQDLR
ncbi:MAG: hypothetical protein M9962_13150 [Oligoflexia bacterium]|nr:hypothetical protein [Oligoflexia bacterium]